MNITTKKYESWIDKVYIDDREKDRIDYAFKQYAPFNPVKTHLDVGDYIFRNEELDMCVVFEYKTANDFLSSIDGNHLHNQVYHMVTNFDYTFVIVQAEDLQKTLQERYYSTGLDMSLSQINGAISDFCVNSTVLFVQTQYQAFDLMMRMAAKIFINKPIRWKYGKKTTNSALNYLTSIRGLGDKAEIICRELDLRTKKDLDDLTVEKLCGVKGIGEKTAEKIIKQLR